MGRKYHELYGACPPLGSGRWVIQIEAIRALTTRQKEKKKKELTFSLSPYLKFVSFDINKANIIIKKRRRHKTREETKVCFLY